MAVGGKKPKPTKLKLLHGERNKDRINKKEPKPKPIAPKMPKWLDEYAKEEWKRIVPELKSLGLLTQIDLAALAGYCDAFGRMREMIEAINEHGIIYTAESGHTQQNAYASILKNAKSEVLRYAAEFGMTPSSRTRISVDTDNDKDDFEDLLD